MPTREHTESSTEIVSQHVLAPGPFDLAFCGQCRSFVSVEDRATGAACFPVCPFCGECRSSVHRCEWADRERSEG